MKTEEDSFSVTPKTQGKPDPRAPTIILSDAEKESGWSIRMVEGVPIKVLTTEDAIRVLTGETRKTS